MCQCRCGLFPLPDHLHTCLQSACRASTQCLPRFFVRLLSHTPVFSGLWSFQSFREFIVSMLFFSFFVLTLAVPHRVTTCLLACLSDLPESVCLLASASLQSAMLSPSHPPTTAPFITPAPLSSTSDLHQYPPPPPSNPGLNCCSSLMKGT